MYEVPRTMITARDAVWTSEVAHRTHACPQFVLPMSEVSRLREQLSEQGREDAADIVI